MGGRREGVGMERERVSSSALSTSKKRTTISERRREQREKKHVEIMKETRMNVGSPMKTLSV